MTSVATTRRGGAVLVVVALALMTSACSDSTTASDQNRTTTTPSSTAPSTSTSTSTTTTKKQEPRTTDPPSTTTTVAEPALIAWEDLENLSFELDDSTIELDDRTIELHNGQATISTGDTETVFRLQNRVTQGDLDNDGDEDLVAHIIEQSPGNGTTHLIVPVINKDGAPQPRAPVHIGDRVVIEEVAVEHGLIEVTLLDRLDDEPFTVITRRTTLEIDLTGAEPRTRVVNSRPLKNLPLPEPDLPDIAIHFESGAISATETGTIEPSQRQTYTLQAAEQQAINVELDAPLGVWLTVDLGFFVLASLDERTQQLNTVLPAGGPWRLGVVSTHGEAADYELTAAVLPLGAFGDPDPVLPLPTIPLRPTAETGDVVHLTFDDGPHPVYTPQTLDVLARHNARATFFVVGSLVERYPAILERIVAEGHTVANHTWNHEDLTTLSREDFDQTIRRTQQILGEHAAPCLRPPYGARDAFTYEWAAPHGLAVALWTVDTFDWRTPGAATIADRIVAGAADGAIISLHDGGGDRSQTVQALDDALTRLADSGLRYEPLC